MMVRLERLFQRILDAPDEGGPGAGFITRIGTMLAEEFAADRWAFYEYRPGGDLVRLIAGEGHESFPDSIPCEGPDFREMMAASAPRPVALPAREPPAGGGDRSRTGAALALPTGPGAAIAGFFILHADDPARLAPPDESTGSCICQALKVALRSQLSLRKTIYYSKGLLLLSSFSRNLAGISESRLFLNRLAHSFREHLGAVAVYVELFERGNQFAEKAVQYAFPEAQAALLRHIVDDVIASRGRPGEWREPFVPVTGDDVRLPGAGGKTLSVFFLPLQSKGDAFGYIAFWMPREEAVPFSPGLHKEGRIFLRELAAEISLRVLNLTLHQQAEALVAERRKRLKELWILQETNKALRGSLKINRILKMILAGATAETGLGFNRAALFLLNERTGLLQGMLGVGPDNAEEADRIWKELSRHTDRSLAGQIELYADTQPRTSRFDARVKGIRIALKEDRGVLAHCVETREPVRVALPSLSSPSDRVLREKLSMTELAATPIVSKEQVFGVMIVDNLFDGKPITDEDLRLLSMFASQAGLAIANAKAHRAHQRAAEELRIARDQLVQTERLAVLGEVAANLAHEIRNPLVTIGGFARRLEKRFLENDPSHKYASIIAGEVKRLEQFLEEVLLFGQDRKPVFQAVQVNDVVRETIRFFKGNFSESRIEVSTCCATDLPLVEADRNQLRQIFNNLFTNAMDAMPEGGLLNVTTGTDREPPPTVFVSVADSGGGVDGETLGNLFNPFFTTKRGGHGLGLSLTQRIVSDHSGRINVKNRPGEGLTFTISLPLPPPAPAVGGQRESNNRIRRGQE